MPHRQLALAAVALLLAGAASLQAADPHLDRTLVPGGCRACHRGHGVSSSPMLPAPQSQVCLQCHDSQAGIDEQVRKGNLDAAARPPLLNRTLARPYRHPLTDSASSRFEAGVVVCSSCHSPHRRSGPQTAAQPRGAAKPSTRSPTQLEYQLCEECHGERGVLADDLLDLRRLFDPSSRSYHPVHAPADERSPSVDPDLAERLINCTDCHGSDESDDSRGVHGSNHPWILSRALNVADGGPSTVRSYALCYGCHDAEKVLAQDSPFPLHRLHVESERTACSTCHSPHASPSNRALVRIGEETKLRGVFPSASTGRLAFFSEIPGSGSCHLTCHGVDHGPKGYGTEALLLDLAGRSLAPAPLPPTNDPAALTRPRPRSKRPVKPPGADTPPPGYPADLAPSPERRDG